MQGNPYYVPNYEQYYQPELERWIDTPISPGNLLGLENRSKRVLRELGPVAPLLAIAGPAAAVTYSAYKTAEKYRQEKAAERERIAREANREIQERRERVEKIRARSAANQQRKILAALSGLNQQIVSLPGLSQQPSYEHKETVPITRPMKIPGPSDPEIRAREWIKLPKVPIHVDIPAVIPKVHVGFSKRAEEAIAKSVMMKIRDQGLDIVNDPAVVQDHYDILRNIPAALLSTRYFPTPYLAFLDEDTRIKYEAAKKTPKHLYNISEESSGSPSTPRPAKKKTSRLTKKTRSMPMERQNISLSQSQPSYSLGIFQPSL